MKTKCLVLIVLVMAALFVCGEEEKPEKLLPLEELKKVHKDAIYDRDIGFVAKFTSAAKSLLSI